MSHEREHEHEETTEHDKPRPTKASTHRKQRGSDAVFASNSAKTAAQVERWIKSVDRQVVLANHRLNTDAAGISVEEAANMKWLLQQQRTMLLTAIGNIPSTEPSVVKAMEASDRISTVVQRLESLEKAHRARAATAADRKEGDSNEILDAGQQRARVGYCDVAPQGVAPCQYDEKTREDLRAQVKEAVAFAHTNWKIALATLHLETKLTPVAPSLQQKLGEALLGVLFGALGSAVKALANKGIDKAAAGLSKDVFDDVTMTSWREGPEPETVALVRKGVDQAVAGGTPLAKEKFKKSMSAVQLSANAVATTQVPADKVGVLKAMISEPEKWATNIVSNVHNLFDEDLAGLAVALPITSPAITQTAFEEKLKDTVHRFEQQVLTVDTAPGTNIRPIQIHWNGKTRMALVAPEKAPNKNMQGEWKHVPVKTGKWTFLRWLDDDMKGMAQARVQEEEGVWAAPFMAMANDAEFWDNKTLELLAQEPVR